MKVGTVLFCLGSLMLAYYWLIFDISVSGDDGGDRVVNLELMQDRLIGTLVSITMLFAGLFMYYYKPQRAATPAPQVVVMAPVAPRGFNYNINDALKYRVSTIIVPSMFRPIWSRIVQSNQIGVALYTKSQLDWGYSSGLDPARFNEFIMFIESYRTWLRIQRSQGLSGLP